VYCFNPVIAHSEAICFVPFMVEMAHQSPIGQAIHFLPFMVEMAH